mgnify:CR=1 FL=1|tara:strand:- start:116 stop:256 length:141 start_codon:yes stop_codon:yes gene_type:complete
MDENKKLSDITSVKELDLFIGDDDITEEEYQDLVSYIQDKNAKRNQ